MGFGLSMINDNWVLGFRVFQGFPTFEPLFEVSDPGMAYTTLIQKLKALDSDKLHHYNFFVWCSGDHVQLFTLSYRPAATFYA